MSGNNIKQVENGKAEEGGEVGGAVDDIARQVQTPQCQNSLIPLGHLIRTILPSLPSNFPQVIKRTTGPWPEQIPSPRTIYVDTPSALNMFLHGLEKLQLDEAQLFLDAEGGNHGWSGTLSTLQATLSYQQDTTCILDVLALGKTLFTQSYEKPPVKFTLTDILEDAQVPKFWFDCRADSAALAGQFGIKMKGVCDLQVLHIAHNIVHRGQGIYLSALAEYMVAHLTLVMGSIEHGTWMKTKEAGKTVMKGQYGRWLERLLSPLLLEYAAGDTKFMPLLYAVLREELLYAEGKFGLWEELIKLIGTETEKRVQDSFIPDFETSKGLVSQGFLDFIDKQKEADLASGAISVITHGGIPDL